MGGGVENRIKNLEKITALGSIRKLISSYTFSFKIKQILTGDALFKRVPIACAVSGQEPEKIDLFVMSALYREKAVYKSINDKVSDITMENTEDGGIEVIVRLLPDSWWGNAFIIYPRNFIEIT